MGKRYNPTDPMVHAIGIAMIAAQLLEFAGKQLKEDNEFYKQANKLLVNRLLETNKPVLAAALSIRNLTHPDLQIDPADPSLDPEAITDEVDSALEVVFFFVKTFLSANAVQLTDLWIQMKNLAEGKPLYTQEDVDHLLRTHLLPESALC